MIQCEIGDKKYILRFDMGVMEYMTDEYGGMDEALKALSGGNTRKAVNGIFEAMVKAWMEYQKEEGVDISMEVPNEIVKKSSPMWLLKYISTAIKSAIEDGMKTVHARTNDNGVRDLYLDEIEEEERKKEKPAGR